MSKRLLLFLTVFATAMAMLIPVASAEDVELQLAAPSKTVTESESGSYIVLMEEEPLVATEGQDNLDTSSAQAKAEELKDVQDGVLEDVGVDASEKVNTYTNALNGFSAFLTFEEALALAAHPKVATVLPDLMYQPDTNDSGDYLQLTVKGGAYDTGITGEGVIVGVIDSGIWPEHPSFADDGSYPDLGIVLEDVMVDDEPDGIIDWVFPACDFGNSAHNAADVAFTCNNKLLGARQMIRTYRTFIGATPAEFDSARDDNGHGSHTASTAAGNAGVTATMYGENLGEISGIAPRARVIAYKGLGALGGFGSDLAAAIDQSVADGVDVINYSVGSGSPAIGPDDIAFLFAADAGVFVATSAGNAGPGDSTIGSPATVPWLTTVGASTQQRFYEGTAKMKGGPTVKGASLTPGTDGEFELVDAEFAGGDLCIPGTLDASVAGKIVLCRRGAIARAAKSQAVAIAGGVGMIMYNNSDSDNLFTDTHVVPSVHVDFTEGIEVKEYIAKQLDKGKAAIAEIKNTGDRKKWKPSPSMTIFSSRGPTGPNGQNFDVIKPDVTAPGLQILAGESPYANAVGDSFQAIAGTSMSSPHVAGLFALMKQAHPDWSAAAAKSALMTTADPKVKDNDRTSQATPFAMGAGEVDPGKVDKKGSAFNPGLVYDADIFSYVRYTCGADLGVFTSGTCAFFGSDDPSDLNLASIGVAELAASQTVTRTVTSVAAKTVKYKAKVKAPSGYSVSVSPSTMTLAPGDSATYEVTITNTGAPANEWRFGEMTLKGGGYEVRSPIAVNSVAVAVPALVTGTGPDGGASFDVLFGYSGAYTAAAHGLEASTVLAGSIGQDPDTNYPSPDDAPGPAGGVDLYAIPVSGAAYFRIELLIPGDDDIDLYLSDSGGNIIAQSTSGGTDELIEMVLPADDTYTLAVHGWGIISAPLPYAIDTWIVSATPGGSLVIDSAPSSATVGSTEPIDLSWTGVPDGTSFGAVSHSDDSGLLALTLVRVDTVGGE